MIKEIVYQSAQYNEMLNLRNEVLRKPIGLNIMDESLEEEIADIHLAFLNEKELVVGTLLLREIEKETIKMRQLAVHENFRRQGIATHLVCYAEQLAKQKHYKHLVLHARESAIKFYKSIDYQIVSDIFSEVSIAHYKMAKSL